MTAAERPRRGALVTGGAGFIGSHLVASLLRAGWSVTVLDDLSTGRRERLPAVGPAFRFVRGSILDRTALDAALSGAEALFHLAAQVSVPESMVDPARTELVNVVGWSRTLEAARDHRVRAAVFASSCSVYGDASELPVSERARVAPRSPYAESKFVGEGLGMAWAEGPRGFAALRLFNVFGAGQEAGGAYAAVIAAFIDCARRGVGPTIYGDGLQTRDFVHVDDVVAAMVLAAERVASGGALGPLNVGSGTPVSLLELWDTIAQTVGCGVVPTHLPAREGDIRDSWADAGMLRDTLGWTPVVSLRDGVARLLRDAALQGTSP